MLYHNEDVNEKYQELVRKVNTLRPDHPEDIFSIRINKARPSDVNILQIALISENASRDLLKKYGERLQEELEKITELKKVALFGLPDQIVRVDLKLDKIAEMNIPLNAIIGSIQSELSNIPGGQVEAGSKTFNVKTSGNYTSAEEISETIVFSRHGKTIQLKDVADVKNDFEETKHIIRLNGYRSIFVTAALKEGNNISTVQEKYQLAIAKVKSELPENIDLITAFYQGNSGNNLR